MKIKMRSKKAIISIISILLSTIIIGQNISDKEFSWMTFNNCSDTFEGLEIFKVVETRPKLNSLDYQTLNETTESIVHKLSLEKSQQTTLKVKIRLPNNDVSCIYKAGIIGDTLSREQILQIVSPLVNLSDFERGKQRNRIVNCEAIFYFFINNGKLTELRFVNIDLK